MSDIVVDPTATTTKPSRLQRLRLGRGPLTIAAIAIVVLFALVALFAPLIAPYDPFAVSERILHAPSADHLLGTDDTGKDILSQLIYGARVSLLIGLAAGLGSLVLGIIVGGIAGYVGGAVDNVLMRIAEMFQIMPAMLIALVIVAVIGRNTTLIAAAVVIALWPQSARIVRSQFLALRRAEFVDAARISSTPAWRIIALEIFPVAFAPAAVQAALDIGRGMLLEAGLSFLGLGDPSTSSWGGVLRRAQPFLTDAWWFSVPAGVCIALMVLSFNLIGDSMGRRGNQGRRAL
ncbi:ABC transporter permease [Jiangella sp. DSM 45060]|uniref:ABC transporter permease n=1 Tax=Jiangella sp. DSM 45060 TaxID=1798224 RepID=UPI00087C9421|nr:ABC transporter permease [Jiangella sp. DSM 45060]SDT16957.1 peptide/nickel transport system permease protein [Jiangella sp. DSM 45060]